MKRNKLGLFGGTFDPIHVGHLIIAEWVYQALELDRVVFIPAGDPPHKNAAEVTPAKDRLAMVKLSIAEDSRFECSEYEVNKRGKSYTVETLQWFREQYGPGVQLYWIIGSDSLLDLPNWYQSHRLPELCQLVVYPRPGFPPEAAVEPFRSAALILDTPEFEFSSTTIRERIARGLTVRYLLHPEVMRYIRLNGIYGGKHDPASEKAGK